MKRPTALVVLAGMVGLAGPAAADETTFCNFFITSLPRVITTQGHYCFDRNLSTAIITGNAITINADFVVLDLNNFKLGGGSAGLGTNAVGIYSSDHRNITVRNGNIRGFKYGIRLVGTSTASGGFVIENNFLDGNTFIAIAAQTGGDSVIRNNVIANTGGTTTTTYTTIGIRAYDNYGLGFSSVRDNVVTNTFQTSGYAAGISAKVVDRNIVKMGTAGVLAIGIEAEVCRDNTVLDNTPGWGLNCGATVGDNYTNVP